MSRQRDTKVKRPVKEKRPRRPRTEMCEHRRHPDQYCSRCDK